MLIGEVSRRSGVSSRMLRHYDRLGLVSPSGRTSGNYRIYSDDDIRRLFAVESLRTLGMSLNDIKDALDGPHFSPAALLTELIERTEQRIADEQHLLARLRSIGGTAPNDWVDVLQLVSALRTVESGSSGRRQEAILAHPDGIPAHDLVNALLAERNPNVAGTLRWAISRAGDDAIEALAVGVVSPDPAVRRHIVDAAESIDSPASTALLARFLDDPDPDVRGPATLALGGRGEVGAVAGLIAMVVEGDRDVAAAEVLGTLAATDASITTELTEYLDENYSAAIRLRITQALADMPGHHAQETLRRLATDPDHTVAGTAQAVLAMRTGS